ncbi:TPA: ABC transporter ATP-binding protein [Candidatus Sumerlaeota bacterium]|jgi:ABC-type lipoprotein export system ATPase subunit|nr:ABC transporter ATP-binding protein [Candidatus Sumerlaeota bacterium]
MLISVENLKVEYHNGNESFTVVDIPNWQVDKGEQVAISGPSGSGKSTLLHVIAGLLPPSSGTVQVCGCDIGQLGEAERDRFRAESIGYIFQSFNLLQGYTALENVLLGMTFSPRKPQWQAATALLEEMGLGHRLHHCPAQMSIGEQQRVAIARALAKRPELILADEPTGSLDPLHTGEVVAKLRQSCREHGCTLIVVSHEREVVEAFERQVSFLELNHAFAKKEAVA